MSVTHVLKTSSAPSANVIGVSMRWLLFGILIFISAWSGWAAKKDLDRIVSQEFRLLDVSASRSEVEIAGAIRGVDLVLSELVDHMANDLLANDPHINDKLRVRQRLSPELRNLLIADAHGIIYAEAQEISLGKNVSDREYFKHHRQAPGDDRYFMSRPFMTYGGAVGTTITRVLRNPRGVFAGVVIASIDPKFFLNSLRPIEPKSDDEAMLVNLHGDIISDAMHPENNGKNLLGGIGFEKHIASNEQVTKQLNVPKLGRKKQMGVFRTFTSAPLIVVVAQDYDHAIRAWQQELVANVIRFLVLAGAAVFFYVLAMRRQISLLAAHQQILQREAELGNFKAIIEATDEAVISRTLDGIITSWNHGAKEVFGYSEAEALGRTLKFLLPQDRFNEEAEMLGKIAQGERIEHFETVRLHKSGRRIDISATISPIYDENGGVVGASKIAHDVTAHKLVEKRVGFLATHDRLTELPNRDLFYDRLSRAISQARRKHQRLAVLFLDLDGFKAVNDQFGHEVGDVTLKEAARRLQASVRDVDTVARLGGDEFAIVLSETQGIADVRHVAEKVIRSISKPMTHNNGTEYGIGVSIGIAQFPDSGGEIDNLMKAADDAMYASKRRGRNCISVSEHVAQKITQASQWVTIDGSHLLGVKEIDEQHQKVADYLNALNSAVYEMMSHGETMRLLDELIEYVSFHFESEEKLMDKSSYPESNDHKDEHHRLVAEVRYLKARFVQGGELFVLQWLKDWLFGHVAGADRRLGEFLKTPQSE